MYLNNISINGRTNSPTVLSRTGLMVYFLNNGQYTDPYQISAVSIFKAENNFYPSSVIGYDGQITSDASSLVLLNFSNSASLTTDSTFDPSNYSIGSTGIFKVATGKYVVVLDSTITESDFNLSGLETIPNTLSATGDYIDVWTVRRVAGSDLDTIINEFTFGSDRFLTVTEPILFRCHPRLVNRTLTLGSKEALKFTTEITIENGAIDSSITNLFRNSLVMNPSMEIFKENLERNIPSRITVSSFADTSSLCEVTSDNTIVFNLDTRNFTSHPEFLAGNFGSLVGSYKARVRFNVLDQVFVSNLFDFIVR